MMDYTGLYSHAGYTLWISDYVQTARQMVLSCNIYCVMKCELDCGVTSNTFLVLLYSHQTRIAWHLVCLVCHRYQLTIMATVKSG